MSENKILLKYFEELGVIEKEARDLYNEFLKELTDPEVIKIVKSIRDDEEEHMKIVQELIDLVK